MENIDNESQIIEIARCGLLDMKNNEGFTLLTISSIYNFIKRAKLLLHYGADPNVEDVHGRTPLFYATCKGNYDMAELLIRYKANVNNQDRYGETVLMRSCRCKSARIFNLLLGHGADANLLDCCGWSALTYAVEEQHNQITQVLSQNKFIINKPGKLGVTPLIMAILNKDLESSRILLENGADVNQFDDRRWTCLKHAMYIQFIKLIELLLSYKPDMYIKDRNGCMALDYAKKTKNKEIEILIQTHILENPVVVPQ